MSEAVAVPAEPIVGGPLYALGRGAVALALRAAARVRLVGAEHIPPTGSLLVVSNHVSLLDPPLLGAALPRPLAFLAKAELFRPAWWGWLFARAGMIPVRRGAPDRRALERCLAVLERGGALVVFAEGTRSANGVLGPAQAGVGLLAARSGAPVLPVAVLGTERVRHATDWLARPTLTVRCGPLLPGEVRRGGGAAYYQERANAIMAAVAALLPPERRGPHGGPAARTTTAATSG